jgi:hypothetical protein
MLGRSFDPNDKVRDLLQAKTHKREPRKNIKDKARYLLQVLIAVEAALCDHSYCCQPLIVILRFTVLFTAFLYVHV